MSKATDRKTKAAPKSPAPFATWYVAWVGGGRIDAVQARPVGTKMIEVAPTGSTPYRTRRSDVFASYHPTFAEAKAAEAVHARLDRARSKLREVKALTPPEDARDA